LLALAVLSAADEEPKQAVEDTKADESQAEGLVDKKQEKRGIYDFGDWHSHHEPIQEEKTLTIVKKIPVPVTHVKTVHVPHVKEVHVPVKVGVPKPYPVVKHVPYEIKEIVKVPVHVTKHYPVEKVVHYPVHVHVEKPVPYEVKGKY
jgi:hypothetical protein